MPRRLVVRLYGPVPKAIGPESENAATMLAVRARGILCATRRPLTAPLARRSFSAPAVPITELTLLRYTYVHNMLEVRDPHRPGHIAHAKASLERGDLLLAGAMADPVDEALFIWQGGMVEAAEEFGALLSCFSTRRPPRCWLDLWCGAGAETAAVFETQRGRIRTCWAGWFQIITCGRGAS